MNLENCEFKQTIDAIPDETEKKLSYLLFINAFHALLYRSSVIFAGLFKVNDFGIFSPSLLTTLRFEYFS